MTAAQLLQQIKAGKIWPVYLVYGEETHLIRTVEHQLITQLLPPDEREDNVIAFDNDPSQQELIHITNSTPFFGSKNVVILREANLLKAKKEGSEDKYDDAFVKLLGNMPPFSHLILLCEGKVDKRKKVYKAIEKNGVVVECHPLKAREVREWLYQYLGEAGRKMENTAVEHLLSIVSLMPQISLGFLQNEMDKVLLYNDAKHAITKHELQEMLSSLPEVSVFAMIEALTEKRIAQALILLQEQLASGQHPLQIIALLARQVRMLCLAKEYSQTLGSQEIAKKLGVPLFVSDKLIRQSKRFPLSVLKNTLVALAEANQKFKTGSAISLENIIIQFCS